MNIKLTLIAAATMAALSAGTPANAQADCNSGWANTRGSVAGVNAVNDKSCSGPVLGPDGRPIRAVPDRKPVIKSTKNVQTYGDDIIQAKPTTPPGHPYGDDILQAEPILDDIDIHVVEFLGVPVVYPEPETEIGTIEITPVGGTVTTNKAALDVQSDPPEIPVDEGIQYQITSGIQVSEKMREFRVVRNKHILATFAGWVPGTCDKPDGNICVDAYEPGNPEPGTNAPRGIFVEVETETEAVEAEVKTEAVEVETETVEVEVETETVDVEVETIGLNIDTKAVAEVVVSPFQDHIRSLALVSSPRLWENHWRTADCISATKKESVDCSKAQFWTSLQNSKSSDGQFLSFSGGTSVASNNGLIGLMFQTARGNGVETIMVGPHLTIPLRDYWMLQGQALIGEAKADGVKSTIWSADAAVTGYRDFGDNLFFGPHIGISSINTKSAVRNSLITGYRVQKNVSYLQGDVAFNLQGGKPVWKATAGFDVPLSDNLKLGLSGSAIIGDDRKPAYGGMAELSWSF